MLVLRDLPSTPIAIISLTGIKFVSVEMQYKEDVILRWNIVIDYYNDEPKTIIDGFTSSKSAVAVVETIVDALTLRQQ